MASLIGNCTPACKDKRTCWHLECKVIRIFLSGKFLVENKQGYVIAVPPAHLEFTDEEREQYKDHDLYATEYELASIEGYQLFLQNSHRGKVHH